MLESCQDMLQPSSSKVKVTKSHRKSKCMYGPIIIYASNFQILKCHLMYRLNTWKISIEPLPPNFRNLDSGVLDQSSEANIYNKHCRNFNFSCFLPYSSFYQYLFIHLLIHAFVCGTQHLCSFPKFMESTRQTEQTFVHPEHWQQRHRCEA